MTTTAGALLAWFWAGTCGGPWAAGLVASMGRKARLRRRAVTLCLWAYIVALVLIFAALAWNAYSTTLRQAPEVWLTTALCLGAGLFVVIGAPVCLRFSACARGGKWSAGAAGQRARSKKRRGPG
jgi:cytochrome c biogenesis factor